mgnify:CR=1 FL=1
MPRKTTARVIERKKLVLNLLREHGELPTSELVKQTDLTHSQVFYVLRILLREGLVEEIKRGKVAYWRLSEAARRE